MENRRTDCPIDMEIFWITILLLKETERLSTRWTVPFSILFTECWEGNGTICESWSKASTHNKKYPSFSYHYKFSRLCAKKLDNSIFYRDKFALNSPLRGRIPLHVKFLIFSEIQCYVFLGYLIEQNRTKIQSNSIERLVSDWVRQSNEIEHQFCCEFDFRTNRTKSTNIEPIRCNLDVFDMFTESRVKREGES